jgi:hypothetical protein
MQEVAFLWMPPVVASVAYDTQPRGNRSSLCVGPHAIDAAKGAIRFAEKSV